MSDKLLDLITPSRNIGQLYKVGSIDAKTLFENRIAYLRQLAAREGRVFRTKDPTQLTALGMTKPSTIVAASDHGKVGASGKLKTPGRTDAKIEQREKWSTHNCAEAHLQRQGVGSKELVAAFNSRGMVRAPCKNCEQRNLMCATTNNMVVRHPTMPQNARRASVPNICTAARSGTIPTSKPITTSPPVNITAPRMRFLSK